MDLAGRLICPLPAVDDDPADVLETVDEPSFSTDRTAQGAERVPASERRREISRRRIRKKKCQLLKRKAEKASVSDKAGIAAKLRKLTPGAEELVKRWSLEDR